MGEKLAKCCVLDFLALDNFDFTRKVVKKKNWVVLEAHLTNITEFLLEMFFFFGLIDNKEIVEFSEITVSLTIEASLSTISSMKYSLMSISVVLYVFDASILGIFVVFNSEFEAFRLVI